MILVAGATGSLGGTIARLLLDQGRPVRVLIRPPSGYQPLVEAGAQPVFGDLKDRASLDRACQGVDIVVTTANSAKRGGDDNPETVDRQGNVNLIDAARAAGVRHFVFVSASLADPNSPVPFAAAKGQAEEYLKASGLPYTILAPNTFMEVWLAMVVGGPALAGQPVALVGSGERKHSFISEGDVARFAVAALDNPAALNRRLVIGGPEALSFKDVAAVFERVLGRPVPVNCFPPDRPVPGVYEHVVPFLAGFDTYDSPMDMSEIAPRYGVRLTPVEDFARRMAGQAAA